MAKDDLTDKKIGRFLVIGFIGKRGNGNNKNSRDGIWLVRCNCGAYETRRTSSLKRLSSVNMCRTCMELENLKRRYNKY
jgi:hypothetical protein